MKLITLFSFKSQLNRGDSDASFRSSSFPLCALAGRAGRCGDLFGEARRPTTSASSPATSSGPAARRLPGRDRESRPAVLCQSLAKRAGKVDSFIVDGRAFTPAELDTLQCLGQGRSRKALAATINFPGAAVRSPPRGPTSFRACTIALPPPILGRAETV